MKGVEHAPGDALKLPGSDELTLESIFSVKYDPHQVMGTKSMDFSSYCRIRILSL